MRKQDRLVSNYPDIYKIMDFEYFYGKQSSQYAFYRIPKQLFTERQFDMVSIEMKLLYGMMIDRMELSQKTGGLTRRAGYTYILQLMM